MLVVEVLVAVVFAAVVAAAALPAAAAVHLAAVVAAALAQCCLQTNASDDSKFGSLAAPHIQQDKARLDQVPSGPPSTGKCKNFLGM